MPVGVETRRPARARARLAADWLTHRLILVGGLATVSAVILIALYLLWGVSPLLGGASARVTATASLTSGRGDVPAWVLPSADVGVVALYPDGRLVHLAGVEKPLNVLGSLALGGQRITAIAREPDSDLVLVGLDNGEAFALEFVRDGFDDKRVALRYPFGPAPIPVHPHARAVSKLTFHLGTETLRVVGLDEDARLFSTEIALATDGKVSSRRMMENAPLGPSPNVALLGQGRLIAVTSRDGRSLRLLDDVGQPVADMQLDGAEIRSLQRFPSGRAFLLGRSDGSVVHGLLSATSAGGWRAINSKILPALDGPVTHLMIGEGRAFIAMDASSGHGSWYHATSGERLLDERFAEDPVLDGVVSRRRGTLHLIADDGSVVRWRLDARHPGVSLKTLWAPVWYEGYSGPRYVWQSTGTTPDSEPKFSLTPLMLGTLKTAFYALLFAAPLALAGAIYTAHFMSPEVRRFVKPGIEMMEALPTVVIGFVAAIWFAPLIQTHLLGTLLVLLLLPISIALLGFGWRLTPRPVREWRGGRYAALALTPILLALIAAFVALGDGLERTAFGGDFAAWLDLRLGIDYQQRNALIIGIAMGFAVIPTIFSLSEDALFSVPKALTHGSLALGATPWQTITSVVLPVASPGIFSAIIIGVGRAVGETMIVLMATGNTPLLSFSPFDGMRTISANIAIEMPESQVGSTHFRVLLLAALVLFLLTFLLNTVAELVRQRLRDRYRML